MALGSCPKCGAPVAKSWKTCPSCGAELDAGKIARENEERLEAQRQKEAEEKARREAEIRAKREAAEAAARAEAERLARMTPQEKAALKAAEEEKLRKEKQAKTTRIVSLAATAAIIVIAIVTFLMLNRPVNERLDMAASAYAKQDYTSAYAQCEKVFHKIASLDADQTCRLVKTYRSLAGKQSDVSRQASERYTALLRYMVNSSDYTLNDYAKQQFPDDVTAILISNADEFYKQGKIGNAKNICEGIYNNRNSLSFGDKCNLASLYCAIVKVDNDPVAKNKCAWLYNQAVAFNDLEAKAMFKLNDDKYGTDIESVVKEVKRASSKVGGNSGATSGKSVIVTGTGVRLRLGPSLQAEILSDFYGKSIHPKKGEYLEYIGEVDGWYHVRYNGDDVWISKDFSSRVQ